MPSAPPTPKSWSTPLTTTPFLKPGNLAHNPGPPTSPSPNLSVADTAADTIISPPPNTDHHPPFTPESDRCIAIQSVTSILSSNPSTGGSFIVFRRKVRTSPAGQTWDVVSGWAYAVTIQGSLLYTGRERAVESGFVAQWSGSGGVLAKLVDPTIEGRTAVSTPPPPPADVGVVSSPPGMGVNVTDKEKGGRLRSFALMGAGNHASKQQTFADTNGTGSWRRLLGEEPADGKATHCVFVELPELVGFMIARGCKPEDVVHALKPGEFGTTRIGFETGEWMEPQGDSQQTVTQDDDDGVSTPERERRKRVEEGKAWKKGWWITRRRGMGIWVS